MTRITNFGFKRTHVQAGFSDDDERKEKNPTGIREHATGPPKKKRKRDRKRRPKMEIVDKGNHELGDAHAPEKSQGGHPITASGERKYKTSQSQPQPQTSRRNKEARRKASSENRRLKRIKDKKTNTTCFVCREKGHAAKECQTTDKNEMEEAGRSVIGICYRCGSRKHNLSRCKKPLDPLNPLPFASCFVCHKKGHLASTCPANKEKGIYPDGGSCKLCGETSHMAKDCGLRKQDPTKTTLILGTGKDAGADEDDFHILNRNKRDVDREEQQSTKKRKKMGAKVEAVANALAVKGTKATRKKVVNF